MIENELSRNITPLYIHKDVEEVSLAEHVMTIKVLKDVSEKLLACLKVPEASTNNILLSNIVNLGIKVLELP